jgi:hypothetical protein
MVYASTFRTGTRRVLREGRMEKGLDGRPSNEEEANCR